MTRHARSLIAVRIDAAAQSCRRGAVALVPVIRGGAADLCVLAGISAIAYGLGLVAKPAAFIFLGIVCILVGLRGVQAPKGGTE